LEAKFNAVVLKAVPYGEFDKILKLITNDGLLKVLIKGVRRDKAKLKPCAVPFAFCEYTAVKKGDFYTITGACPVEDLSGGLASCLEKISAASIILQAASFAFLEGSDEYFISMLCRIRDIILGAKETAFIPSIRFLQQLIHSGGYAYKYQKYEKLETPLDFLSLLYFEKDDRAVCRRLFGAKNEYTDKAVSLIDNTLRKIIKSFENRFDCVLNVLQ